MTRTHWFLHLTTTFTFALLAAAGNSCPRDYPFAFNGGYACCASYLEDSLSPHEVEGLDESLVKSCNGGLISKSSRCCPNSKYVRCENPPCESHGTCTSPKCRDISKRLFKFMNPEVNPCQDFNKFACGKFIEEYELPPDKTTWSPLKSFEFAVLESGKRILEKVPKKESKFITDKYSWKVYESCMNMEKIEIDGRSRIKKILKKLGGWPAVEGSSWNSNEDWWDLDQKRVALGLDTNYVMDFLVSNFFGNTSKYSLVFDQPVLGLSRSFLLEGFDSKTVQLYYKFMAESAKLMGAKNDTAYEDMKQALLFEIDLANISDSGARWSHIENMNNIRTIRELEGQPGYPPSLLEYINNFFTSAGVPEVQFDLDERVTVWNTKYAGKLSGVLGRTSRRAIGNYQSWRVFHSLAPLLHNDVRNLLEEFENEYQGLEKTPPRWSTCVHRAGFNLNYWDFGKFNPGMILAAGSLYAREYFTPEGKERVKELFEYLKNSFKNNLISIGWMDRKSKCYALKKLKAMRGHLVYHDDLLKPDVLNNFFKDLKITDSFFDNVLAIQKFWRTYYMRDFRNAIDSNHFTRNQLVAMGNAYHKLDENFVKLPGGILHESVLDPFGPKFKNYGGIGFVINHEITHGFDNLGRQFDLDGNLKSWMENTTNQNFNDRAKCFVYQYGNITSKQANMTLNSVGKLSENIADNGALNAAYSAYEKDIKENGEELILPGISLTTRQLFYLFYGQFFCAKWRKQALINQINSGWHAPEEFRINVPISNSVAFAKVFNCPLGSPMNPVKKCKVW